MDLPLSLQATRIMYPAIVLLGTWLAVRRRFNTQQALILTAFAVSVVFNLVEMVTHSDNHWVNVIWPRFQGGLFLAAMTSKPKYRIALMAAPPAIATWLNVIMNGLTPFAEKMVEVSVFAAVIVMASRQRDPWLRWAMLLYCLATVILSPFLAALATQGAWESWVSLFEIVHVGRIAGMVLCGVWFWRSTRPEPLQLELWPA